MVEIIVLGIAQDGGVPHAGCLCVNCRAARSDPARRHPPVSLGILSGERMAMVDATDGFEEQLAMLWDRNPQSKFHEAERFPAPEAVVLTHAHVGHYAGIWQFDRSVLAARSVGVTGPPETITMLRQHEPWKAIEHEGHIRFEPGVFNVPFALLPDVDVTMYPVPHRSEWGTDTAALAIRGPKRSLLYLPDIDRWDEWDRDLGATIQEFDVVMLDGCFWVAPPREGVPHPPITETMERLQHLAGGRTQIIFTHINHSNPVLTPGSDESMEVYRRGFSIAAEGDVFEL